MNDIPKIVQAVPDPVWTWGPGFFALAVVIAFLIVFMLVFFKLANAYIPEFIQASRDQAEAMTKMAVCIEQEQSRRNNDFDRVLLQLRLIHDDFTGMRNDIDSMRRDTDSIKGDIDDVKNALDNRRKADE
jgi:hypothetical protein